MAPGTRSSSRQPLQANRSHTNLHIDQEVIILSSDDEAASVPRKRIRPNSKQAARSKGRTPMAIPHDVVEISSDDDTPPVASCSSVTALQLQIKALQEENERLRKQTAQVMPIVSPEMVQAAESQKRLLTALDDQLSCEICTLRMWTPYTLGCGHTFCQSCLQDWFGTTLAKHMTEHPEYNANPPQVQQYHFILRQGRIGTQQRRHLEDLIERTLRSINHPKYTCPTCRVAVKDRPTEVYSLKQVVRTIADTMGETSPKKTHPPRGARDTGGPWDGFFPVLKL
ncbi:unnamed protein product [Somion occarium]|uniref:RING-type domain-containing protein n=1 Tax=Somion occarium TaxID=3059160 RepID=A0ABP1DL32_9APHY